MKQPKQISISDFSYDLPEDRIALYPLSSRDESKLLIYKDKSINEAGFQHLGAHLPGDSFLIFNDTRVINARIPFHKPTGGRIEIFCLEAVEKKGKSGENIWHCLVGGAAKWKEGLLHTVCESQGKKIILHAECLERKGEIFTIRFTWDSDMKFEEVISLAGTIPIPPYLKRAAEPQDHERYQTIYAASPGSVAAPTAGLHFTPAVMEDLESRHIGKGFVTLHVSAGTFKPVDAPTMEGHSMHAEWIDVKKDMIRKIRMHEGPVIAVGTTGMRTLETLYWLGVKAALDPGIHELKLTQWEVYEEPLTSSNMQMKEALQALLDWMEEKQTGSLISSTELLITPGYRFRICRGLITNFHQPRSTLLLLVAAVAGEDWKKIYRYALEHDFRFLSYGDSSLLFIDQG